MLPFSAGCKPGALPLRPLPLLDAAAFWFWLTDSKINKRNPRIKCCWVYNKGRNQSWGELDWLVAGGLVALGAVLCVLFVLRGGAAACARKL
jgi:hypothetical protein